MTHAADATILNHHPSIPRAADAAACRILAKQLKNSFQRKTWCSTVPLFRRIHTLYRRNDKSLKQHRHRSQFEHYTYPETGYPNSNSVSVPAPTATAVLRAKRVCNRHTGRHRPGTIGAILGEGILLPRKSSRPPGKYCGTPQISASRGELSITSSRHHREPYMAVFGARTSHVLDKKDIKPRAFDGGFLLYSHLFASTLFELELPAWQCDWPRGEDGCPTLGMSFTVLYHWSSD
ncbi:hypothetical protein FB45DRAFT_1130759 [Roridomyces roridus]|uniref:Uncharacterized protein n=1 Tax=Roridomyces roridus TaxID=1738132 RepID=A0AAD7B1R0_9AGAR|nr:hypothetical protein FB45DRAFT_1130759 [Roridomyces roridus]